MILHDAALAEYNRLHEQFGLSQAERYQRFQALLNAVRGAFRGDKTVLASLEPFKRSIRRAAKGGAAAGGTGNATGG